MKSSRFNRRSFFTAIASVASTAACGVVGRSSSSTLSDKSSADYDYIIVGSGAGGGPLAVNLARSGFKVLLLEAGTDQGLRDVYKVPAFHTQSTEDSEMAWDFYVDHFVKPADNQVDSKYVAGQGLLYPRAGTVGGCTAHNAMITVYPLAKDWDQLGDDVGDASYNGQTMRKYFQLCENAQYSDQPARKKGWLPINYASPFLILKDRAILALLFSAWRKIRKDTTTSISAIESILQLVVNPDTNADSVARDTSEGLVMIPTATTSDGRRYSTRDLIVAQLGKNLTLRTSCLVSRVLFDESGDEPVATGVEYIVGDKIYQASKNPNPASSRRTRVYAKHDVILAGGTFNTPQMLMASGIGPKEELQRFAENNPDYKVIVDRPGVGANLQDRYEVSVVSKTEDNLKLIEDCQFQSSLSDPCYTQWALGGGPYTSNGGIIGMFKKSKPTLSHPDLFIFLLPTDFHGYFPGYSKTVATAKNSTTWAILKTHSQNRGGRVALKSLDPTVRPLINFKYYEDGTDAEGNVLTGGTAEINDDLEAVVSGVEFVREITASASTTLAILDISAELPEGPTFSDPYFQEVVPGKNINRKDKLREWVRRNSWGHHACGTCKMGEASDPMAVVDSKFRVLGTKNLRVVDASVFPRIPGYFIASSIYAMSERATDEILEDRGLQRRIKV
jgi:choline dehydrogenase